MNDYIEKKVNEWSLLDSNFRDINQQIIHLEKRLFRDYLPCQTIDSDFFFRFKRWLSNSTDDEEQKLLFQLVPHLFYVSNEEINSLYHSAYNIYIARWLIDCIGLEFNTIDAEAKLKKAVSNTWFCPVTDSFLINNFIKINNVPSRFDLRPDWHSLTELGDPSTIADYVKTKNIERIVMLEDFVGSGSQVESRVEFATQCFPHIPILFISLITCPVGITTTNDLSNKYANLTVKHVVELPAESFISEIPKSGETQLFVKIRQIASKLYLKTTNGIAPGAGDPYDPLGYMKTGGMVVLATNTPDNTLPMIHFESTTWLPLFKRITRI